MLMSHAEAVSIHHPWRTVASQDLCVISACNVSLSVLPCYYTGHKCQSPSDLASAVLPRNMIPTPLCNTHLLFIDLVSSVTLVSTQREGVFAGTRTSKTPSPGHTKRQKQQRTKSAGTQPQVWTDVMDSQKTYTKDTFTTWGV